MTTALVKVTAPCRLHFGLLSFNRPTERQFGGLGVMINNPCVTIQGQRAERFQVSGKHADRLQSFASRWAKYRLENSDSDSSDSDSSLDFVSNDRSPSSTDRNESALPPCHLRTLYAPEQHVGLGVGTQLGLAVASCLNRIFGVDASLDELARSVGRGKRSSIGSLGFQSGGLLFERGTIAGETISKVERRVQLPSAWRVLLIQPPTSQAMSGKREQAAFDQLDAVPRETTRDLIEESVERLLPAAENGDYEAFCNSVFRYGELAGSCFAKQQGGAFSSTKIAALVKDLRASGIAGVGQSSWGPTVFAFQPNHDEATELVARMSREQPDCQVWVSSFNDTGATIEVLDD